MGGPWLPWPPGCNAYGIVTRATKMLMHSVVLEDKEQPLNHLLQYWSETKYNTCVLHAFIPENEHICLQRQTHLPLEINMFVSRDIHVHICPSV